MVTSTQSALKFGMSEMTTDQLTKFLDTTSFNDGGRFESSDYKNFVFSLTDSDDIVQAIAVIAIYPDGYHCGYSDEIYSEFKAYLSWIQTRPTHQKTGLASRLLTSMQEYWQEKFSPIYPHLLLMSLETSVEFFIKRGAYIIITDLDAVLDGVGSYMIFPFFGNKNTFGNQGDKSITWQEFRDTFKTIDSDLSLTKIKKLNKNSFHYCQMFRAGHEQRQAWISNHRSELTNSFLCYFEEEDSEDELIIQVH